MRDLLNVSTKIAMACILAVVFLSSQAMAEDFETTTVIKDHKFDPSTIKVPAGKKIKLIVDNQDDTLEEFDSQPLNREKTIDGHSKGTIYFGPLDPGTYSFIGEFHEKTAFGVVIAE